MGKVGRPFVFPLSHQHIKILCGCMYAASRFFDRMPKKSFRSAGKLKITSVLTTGEIMTVLQLELTGAPCSMFSASKPILKWWRSREDELYLCVFECVAGRKILIKKKTKKSKHCHMCSWLSHTCFPEVHISLDFISVCVCKNIVKSVKSKVVFKDTFVSFLTSYGNIVGLSWQLDFFFHFTDCPELLTCWFVKYKC